jgi:predicted TIM-barrel fold metal-dependent hydrolase
MAIDRKSATESIDVHQHYASPRWLNALEDAYIRFHFPGLRTLKNYSVHAAIEAMDKGGVSKAFLSTTTPGIWFGNSAQTAELARDLNEVGAKLVADHKPRFGLFGVLPLPDVDASLIEIEYAFDRLKADGVGVLSSYGSAWLGDSSFAPVWQELNRRKAVVFSHGTAPESCRNLMTNLEPTTIEFNTDTSRTIASLIESGTATRFPDIRFIFSHAGGTMPALAGRYLEAQATAAQLKAVADPNSRLGHLRKFFYDTAGSHNPIQMKSLKMLVSASQILFGTDVPWGDPTKAIADLEDCGFTTEELRAILHGNALDLFSRIET